MVKGIEKFSHFFEDYTDNYILIGGAACEARMSEAGLNFRATKDLDIVLIVEALEANFVTRFWDFVKQGNYEKKEKGKRKYYRFMKPENTDFPYQLELFSRKPDILDLAGNIHLMPVQLDKDLSSLSAILMNDDYYSFTIKNSRIENRLHLASVEALICLKAKAFLDLTDRKEKGERMSEKEIRKHKNDIIRLAVMLREKNEVDLPASIAGDMKEFMEFIKSDPPDYQAIGKMIGLPNINGEGILKQIEQNFKL